MTIPTFPSPWAARFADLPMFPGKSILPVHDGDIAHLRDTANAILDRLRAGATGIVMLLDCDRTIYRETKQHTGIDPRRRWPADAAKDLLQQWGRP